MKHHRDILASLDDFIEVTDRPLANRARQRPVDPDSVSALEEIAPRQVSGRKIVVARHGVNRSAQPRRHVRYEPRLAAAGRSLQQDWKLVAIGVREDLAFRTGRRVERHIRRHRDSIAALQHEYALRSRHQMNLGRFIPRAAVAPPNGPAALPSPARRSSR